MALSSIIVVNRNGGPILQECIASVFKNTSGFELILVDNGSTDGSELQVAKAFPDTVILRNGANLGFAKANNLGILRSSGSYIVLLNPDTLVTTSWLENLIKVAEGSAEIGLVSPKLIRPGDPPTLDSAGHLYQYETGIPKDRGQGEVNLDRYDHYREIPSCCFACALVKREVFSHIGLLDEAMFLYFEDVDFGLRARLAGWRIEYCPASIVYHLRRGSTPEADRERLETRSKPYQLRIILKDYELKNLIRFGASSVALAGLRRMATGLGSRNWGYSAGYPLAVLWNLVHLPLKERLITQKTRKVPDKVLFSVTGSLDDFRHADVGSSQTLVL